MMKEYFDKTVHFVQKGLHTETEDVGMKDVNLGTNIGALRGTMHNLVTLPQLGLCVSKNNLDFAAIESREGSHEGSATIAELDPRLLEALLDRLRVG